MVNTLYRGDTWVLEVIVVDESTNLPIIDLINHEIRFTCISEKFSIKCANNKVQGGSVEEVTILGDGKTILVTIPKEKTINALIGNYDYEIEITSLQGKRSTIIRDSFKVNQDLITWEAK